MPDQYMTPPEREAFDWAMNQYSMDKREGHRAAKTLALYIKSHQDRMQQDIVAELVEALDNVTASLETMLAHYGSQCPEDDNRARESVARSGRILVQSLRAETGGE